MDPITGLAVSQAIQGVAGVAQGLMRSATSESQPNFAEHLRSFLPNGTGNKINEEELFASLLQERIATTKGAEAASKFAELLANTQDQMRRNDGYVPVEKAANKALKSMEEEGLLTGQERSDIHDAAFASAQLDSNHEALFDGRGSSSDNTVAEADIETALAAAQLMMANFDTNVSADSTSVETASATPDTSVSTDTVAENTGALTPETSSSGAELTIEGDKTTLTPSNFSFDGPDGFVFKPESEHEKKLVVLLPPELAQKVDQVAIKDQNGNTIEQGHSSGFANGGREHIRFDKAGREYGEDVTVEVTLSNGDIMEYLIEDPSERYD